MFIVLYIHQWKLNTKVMIICLLYAIVIPIRMLPSVLPAKDLLKAFNLNVANVTLPYMFYVLSDSYHLH